MKDSVVVRGVAKRYGRHDALVDLSFTVPEGMVYGLIGPNGAGKTTSLSILAGLVTPTSGDVSILGIRVGPNRRELMSKVGFATPRLSFFDYLSGAEVILTCALMHGLGAREAEQRLGDLLALLELEGAAGNYLHEYSQGMRQKIGLACALIHSPEVLLLDEPFTGLDPASVYRLVETLRRIAARGHTIVLTSHDLGLVEKLCHKVGVLHEGTLRREIEMGKALRSEGKTPRASLESALWDIVGTPECVQIPWL